MASHVRPAKRVKLDHEEDTSSPSPQTTEVDPKGPSKTTTEDLTKPTPPRPSTGSEASKTDPDPTNPIRGNIKDTALLPLAASHPTLSKNALKKLLRQQRWEEAAPARRAKRKADQARRKERKRAAREDLITGGVEPTSLMKGSERFRAVQLPVTLVVDCQFDGLMTDGERASLGQQLTRCYSANKAARWRVHLAIASWGDRLRERFDSVLRGHYRGWKGVRFCDQGVEEVVRLAEGWMTGGGGGGGKLEGPFRKFSDPEGRTAAGGNGDLGTTAAAAAVERQAVTGEQTTTTMTTTSSEGAANGAAREDDHHQQQHMKRLRDQGEIVYLSSESPNTLHALKPYSTYIVGGLVDKNREKGICYKRACEAGIKTARLPIGEFLEMQSRKVLATNHVVEIMLKWLEYEDWGKALVEVVPKRKGGKLRGTGEDGGAGDDDDEGAREAESDESGVEDLDVEDIDEGFPVESELEEADFGVEDDGTVSKKEEQEKEGDRLVETTAGSL